MKDTITFDTYTKVETYLNDKNDVYRYKFYAANCDPDKVDEVDSIDNKDVSKNVATWVYLMTINPQKHEEINGMRMKEVLADITTEDWVHITTLIDLAEVLPTTFIAIFQYLCKDEISIENIKNMDHRKPMEHVAFFLQNYKRLIDYSHIYSLNATSKKMKNKIRMIMNNIHLLPPR